MEEQSAESGEPKEEEMVGEWIGELEVEELVWEWGWWRDIMGWTGTSDMKCYTIFGLLVWDEECIEEEL